MTREQRASHAEWCRQRATDISLLEHVDFTNPALERQLAGEDFKLYAMAITRAEIAQKAAWEAFKDYEAIAERLEANAD